MKLKKGARMRLTESQLIRIKNEAITEYTSAAPIPRENPDAFLTRCWLNAINLVLSKEGDELYVFPKNYNSNIVDPNKFLDISGKLELD